MTSTILAVITITCFALVLWLGVTHFRPKNKLSFKKQRILRLISAFGCCLSVIQLMFGSAWNDYINSLCGLISLTSFTYLLMWDNNLISRNLEHAFKAGHHPFPHFFAVMAVIGCVLGIVLLGEVKTAEGNVHTSTKAFYGVIVLSCSVYYLFVWSIRFLVLNFIAGLKAYRLMRRLLAMLSVIALGIDLVLFAYNKNVLLDCVVSGPIFFFSLFYLIIWVVGYAIPMYVQATVSSHASSHHIVSRRKETNTQCRFYTDLASFNLMEAHTQKPSWQRCLIEIHQADITVRGHQRSYTFYAETVRWIGEPKMISEDNSWVCFDLEMNDQWYVLEIEMLSDEMGHFIKRLNGVLPGNILHKRNRRRPNIRCGPVVAHPAVHTADDQWLLAEPVELYLTPLYLVLFSNTFVQEKIPLRDLHSLMVEPIAALPGQHLVQFEWQTKILSLAVQDQGFANALKTAVD